MLRLAPDTALVDHMGAKVVPSTLSDIKEGIMA